jgi:hypothetical protein
MLTRRRFVLAGSAALAGLVVGGGRRVARAAVPAGPVRFLAVRTPHGVDRDFWIPRNSDGSEPKTEDEALSGLTFEYDNSIMNAMTPWRDQITILDGLDSQCTKENTRSNLYPNHGHNEQGTMLTGAQGPAARDGNFDNHPSLDFYLHGLLGAPVLPTASVSGAGTWKCMSFDSTGIGRTPETSPAALFKQAFPSDFTPPDPGVAAVDYANGENRIINAGQAQLAALEARLQGVEKDKIAAHMDAMKALLQTPGMPPKLAQCTTKGSDVPTNKGGLADYTLVQPVARAHAAVIAQAFACGRAKCATLRILELLHPGPRGSIVGRRGALWRGLPLPREPRARLLGRAGRHAHHVAQGLHRGSALGRRTFRRGARRILQGDRPARSQRRHHAG